MCGYGHVNAGARKGQRRPEFLCPLGWNYKQLAHDDWCWEPNWSPLHELSRISSTWSQTSYKFPRISTSFQKTTWS